MIEDVLEWQFVSCSCVVCDLEIYLRDAAVLNPWSDVMQMLFDWILQHTQVEFLTSLTDETVGMGIMRKVGELISFGTTEITEH